MTGRVRAGWRLARCTVHVLHGALIVLWRFRRIDAAERHSYIRWWARKLLRLIGVTLEVEGLASARSGSERGGTLMVANHVSWLDMNALHAVFPQVHFVSKAAVQDWPVLSQLADAAGTLYLTRERKRDALRVVQLMATSLAAGETVAIFPEGTTSDGRGLLPFHANLLQAAVASAVPVQPVALRYSDAAEDPSRAVEFVGETTLVQSMWRIAQADRLTVHVIALPTLPSEGRERRALTAQAQSMIGAALRRDRPDARPSAQPLP